MPINEEMCNDDVMHDLLVLRTSSSIQASLELCMCCAIHNCEFGEGRAQQRGKEGSSLKIGFLFNPMTCKVTGILSLSVPDASELMLRIC